MLAARNKLGPYEIQAPLGAGGMGEIYRARDTRLDRTAAIKFRHTTFIIRSLKLKGPAGSGNFEDFGATSVQLKGGLHRAFSAQATPAAALSKFLATASKADALSN